MQWGKILLPVPGYKTRLFNPLLSDEIMNVRYISVVDPLQPVNLNVQTAPQFPVPSHG